MADEVYKLIEQALASTQGGRNRFYDPVADIALQIPSMIQQSNENEKIKNHRQTQRCPYFCHCLSCTL